MIYSYEWVTLAKDKRIADIFLAKLRWLWCCFVLGSQYRYKEILLDALDYYTNSKQFLLVIFCVSFVWKRSTAQAIELSIHYTTADIMLDIASG